MGPESAVKLNLATTALGGALGGIGSVLEGRDARQAGAFKAAVLRNNARISNLQADRAIEGARVDVQRRQITGGQIISEQQASLAGRGVAVGQDTGAALASDVNRLTQLDTETVIRNAETEALALRLRGATFELQADQAEAAGRQAQIAGAIEGAGTFLTTAGKVSSKWKAFQKSQEEPTLSLTSAQQNRILRRGGRNADASERFDVLGG